jgi:hypothetical protein
LPLAATASVVDALPFSSGSGLDDCDPNWPF